MPPVSVLIKPASSLCNMSCGYCFYCDESKKRSQFSYGSMSEQTLRNVIRRTILRADGMVSFAFQGGEPTLAGLDFFKRAVELEQQYNKNHIRVDNSLQTNGLLLDEKWCRFLSDNHFLVGLSLDGTRDIHDAIRRTETGKPTFDRALKAAEMMDAFGVDYNILTVVTPEIADNIQTIYAFYLDHGWNYQQYIACLAPLYEPYGSSRYSLSPESYGQFLNDLFDLWYEDLLEDRQPHIRQFDNYAAIAAGHVPESCDMRGSCGIQYVVEADGSVYPCDFYALDEYRLGNFNTERLDAIDEARKKSGFLDRSLLIDPACRKCPYFRLCRCGCQRTRSWNALKEAYRSDLCEGYKIFFEHSYDKLMDIGRALYF